MNLMDPNNFDWVAARSGCSAAEVFDRLRAGVESDLALIQEFARTNQRETIIFKSSMEGNNLVVMRSRTKNVRTVCFAPDKSGITITLDPAHTIKAIPSLNNDGDCVLVVDGQEFRLWQIRKLALEDLFFGE